MQPVLMLMLGRETAVLQPPIRHRCLAFHFVAWAPAFAGEREGRDEQENYGFAQARISQRPGAERQPDPVRRAGQGLSILGLPAAVDRCGFRCGVPGGDCGGEGCSSTSSDRPSG